MLNQSYEKAIKIAPAVGQTRTNLRQQWITALGAGAPEAKRAMLTHSTLTHGGWVVDDLS